jgi:hypothetical protein
MYICFRKAWTFENQLKIRVKLFASRVIRVFMIPASVESHMVQFCSDAPNLQSPSLDPGVGLRVFSGFRCSELRTFAAPLTGLLPIAFWFRVALGHSRNLQLLRMSAEKYHNLCLG